MSICKATGDCIKERLFRIVGLTRTSQCCIAYERSQAAMSSDNFKVGESCYVREWNDDHPFHNRLL